ncbi:hypothetical protein HZB88_02600 [archaeon]|nr:hypothetical protein [archaeon]
MQAKEHVKNIIERLTSAKPIILAEKVFFVAGEFGIGENLVQEAIKELAEENFLAEPMPGVIKRLG